MSAVTKLSGALESLPPLQLHAGPGETRASIALSLSRLRGLVLMAGTSRSGTFLRKIRRSVVDLPVTADQKLLDIWQNEWRDVMDMIGRPELELRLMVDREAAMPRVDASGPLRVERDPKDFRGTGGMLADVAREYAADEYLMAASAGQLLAEPLESIVSRLAGAGGMTRSGLTGADVALAANADERPTGIMLIRCGALAEIPEEGFVDFKEQALPAIARQHSVTVSCTGVVAHPIRTAGDYLWALRQHHRQLEGRRMQLDGLEEDWRPTFSVIEPGAKVAASAKVYDSVVLEGGVVEDGAVLVRTVVCGGGVVRKQATAVDMVVSEKGGIRHTA